MNALSSDYNIALVILSVVIAIFAAYTALDLAGRVTATQGNSRLGWLGSGAIAMGFGIWSMHFIGMLAFRLPLTVHYNISTVFISILPAIIASAIALFVASRKSLNTLNLLAGSLFMGLGIASMHYIGMEAIQSNATIQYDLRIVALSVFVAIAVSGVGLYIVFSLREESKTVPVWQKSIAAIVIGSAIPTMHYIGMAAANFLPIKTINVHAKLQAPDNVATLATGVILSTLIILGIAILTAFFDRRLSVQIIYNQALENSQKYLKTIIEGIQVGVLVFEENIQIKLSNQAALDLLNLSSEDELNKLFSSDSKKQASTEISTLKPLFDLIEAKQPVENVVLEMKLSENSKTTSLLTNIIPLQLTPNSNLQVVCTFNNFTDLKEKENQLRESEGKFKELAREEEIFSRLSSQIRESLDLNVILQTAVYEVRRLFETDRALIYKFNADWCGQVILEECTEEWRSTLGEAADNCFPEEFLELYRQGAIRSMKDLSLANLDPEHFEFLQRLQVKANLIIPIMVQEELWGLLIVHQCSHPRDWQEKEGILLFRLATQLGIAIQQSELYKQAEENALESQKQTQKLLISEQKLRQKSKDLQEKIKELQDIQVQLVQSEKLSALGELVAGVAHEINNPVNFIHGNIYHVEEYSNDLLSFLQLYQQQYPEANPDIQKLAADIDLEFLIEDLPGILQSIKIGTERIRNIVLSLRNFSRLDEADSKRVDIHEGIENTLLILNHRLKATSNRQRIEIIKEYGKLPLIECFPGPLNQVFMNILVNAIDALEEFLESLACDDRKERQNTITISTTIVDKTAQITISDNGIGMPEKIRTQIFTPFFSSKPVGKGTGLGMSISYQIIVEQHNGKIDCFSIPNQGTDFVVTIPIHQPSLFPDQKSVSLLK